MKILLTGLPKSGKSTILTNLIAGSNPKRGLTSPEVRANGERIGFDLRDEQGNAATLSRVGANTNYTVGRYNVDLESLEHFIEPLFKYNPNDLLFMDEIGQMQLYSKRFEGLVKDYIGAQNDFIGTVSQVYQHPLISELKQNKDILVCMVTPGNRKQLTTVLVEALNHRTFFGLLSVKTQRKALELARSYLASEQYISLKKLFKNAIPYTSDGKVSKEGDEFVVRGNTTKHHVRFNQSALVCDCDFFNGRGAFASQPGECSHIQAIKLFLS